MAKVTVLKTVEDQENLNLDEASSVSASGVGGRLRAARLKSGKTLAQISNTLKIRQTHLTAIETEDFANLPGGAYTVGFIRTYAEAVGENGEEIVAILKERQAVTTDVELPKYEKIETDVLPSKGTMAAGLALLAVVLGGWFAYTSDVFVYEGSEKAEESKVLEETKPVEDISAQKKIELEQAVKEMEQQEAESQKEPLESVNDILAAMTQNTAVKKEEVKPASAKGLPVTLVAHEDVWLSVYDKSTPNAPVLNTVLKKGKTYNVPAEGNLMANIGRPHVLSMKIGETEYPNTGPDWGGVIKKLPLNSEYLVHTFYGQKVNEESYGRWVKKQAQ